MLGRDVDGIADGGEEGVDDGGDEGIGLPEIIVEVRVWVCPAWITVLVIVIVEVE